MFDTQDDDGFDFSVLDKARIEDLSIGEKMQAESGTFMVLKRPIGYDAQSVKGEKIGIFRFPNIEKLFDFLENN